MRLFARPRHPVAAAAALLTWSAVGFCGVYWTSQVLASPAPAPEAVQPLPAAQKEAADREVLARAPGAHPASAQTPAPATSRWSVKGVVATPDGQGAAVMTDGSQPPRVYRAGAVLADGTRVLRIERDGVVILHAGLAQEMKLMVPSHSSVSTTGAQTDASAPAVPAAAATTQTSNRPQIERTPPPPGTVPTVATAAGEAAAQMKPPSEEEVQNLRQALEEEKAKALTAPGAPGFFVRSGFGPLVPPAAQR